MDEYKQTIGSIKSVILNNQQSNLDAMSARLSEKPKKVLIINTGGTISMFPSDKGYVTKRGALQQYLHDNIYSCDADYTFFQGVDGFLITPLSTYKRRIMYKIIELDHLIDSSNMDSQDWVKVAQAIEENYNIYDSFIVLHGTDTMAYTASALSFMFQNLQKTIVLTGSQIPASQPRNDAFKNLLNAITIAGHFTIPEVLITFSDKLLRGNRAQKVNPNAIDAFDSPKFKPLGVFGVNTHIAWELILAPSQGPLQVNKQFCTDVSAIRMNPLLTHNTLKEIFKNTKLRGLVIETYGAGNMKTDAKFKSKIKKASLRGVIILNISQCYQSTVEMIYETGVVYQEMGVISGGDMTCEAAVTKLSYLLGQDMPVEQIKIEMQKDLRGELTLPRVANPSEEPFLVALQSALQSTNIDVDLNRDLVFPSILSHMAIQHRSPNQDLSTIDINYGASDYDKRTILHVASREGSYEIAEMVLKNAPETINKLDRWDHSPMFEAIRNGNEKMITLLAQHGGKLIAPDPELAYKLMKYITEREDIRLLELYQLSGITNFSRFLSRDLRTVAHVAASVGNTKVIEFLQRPGIEFDWTLKDKFGRTYDDEIRLMKSQNWID